MKNKFMMIFATCACLLCSFGVSFVDVKAADDSLYPPLPDDISTYYVMVLPNNIASYSYAWIVTSPEPFTAKTKESDGSLSTVFSFGAYDSVGNYLDGAFGYSLSKSSATGNLVWVKNNRAGNSIHMSYKPNFLNNFDIKERGTDDIVFPRTPGIVPPVSGDVILGAGWWTAITTLVTPNVPLILTVVGLMGLLAFLAILVRRSLKS